MQGVGIVLGIGRCVPIVCQLSWVSSGASVAAALLDSLFRLMTRRPFRIATPGLRASQIPVWLVEEMWLRKDRAIIPSKIDYEPRTFGGKWQLACRAESGIVIRTSARWPD